jgi:manganese/zinc/iron transport system substrate-binding protein
MCIQTFILWGFPLLAMALAGCSPEGAGPDGDLAGRSIRVVATTGMVADAVRDVGGDRVDVEALMGPGVDPHLYKASEGDVTRMARADVIFYNGLHLEGKLTEVFEQMERRHVRTVAVTGGIDPSMLLSPPEFEGAKDPHVWFDVSLWSETIEDVRAALTELDPEGGAFYAERAEGYREELHALDRWVRDRVQEVPPEQRVLITAHDAFAYFGRAYGFEVRGLLGISTASEAGASDVQQLAAFIAERRIPAVFVETSVPPRFVNALREAVIARGLDVAIGGSLYSDALGDPDTPAATYVGTVRTNVDTIVDALTAAGGSEP